MRRPLRVAPSDFSALRFQVFLIIWGLQTHDAPQCRRGARGPCATPNRRSRRSSASALVLSHLVDVPQRLQARADEAVHAAALGDSRAAEEAVLARVLAALRRPDAAGAAMLEAAALAGRRRQRAAAALAQPGAAARRLDLGPDSSIRATQIAIEHFMNIVYSI